MFSNTKYFVYIVNEVQRSKVQKSNRTLTILIALQISWWITRSKALENSVYTPSAWGPFSISQMTEFENSIRLVAVRKPCGVSMILVRITGVRLWQTIFSNSFGIADRIEIPRWLTTLEKRNYKWLFPDARKSSRRWTKILGSFDHRSQFLHYGWWEVI
jgi:hypothetical protein